MEHEPHNEPLVSLVSVSKIEQLSQQAWEFSMKSSNCENQGIAFRDKFAELIIRECIWVVYNSYCLNKEAKITNHLDKVKQHFGVKE